jgi:long-chain acyl-CoA synthetase
MNQDLEKHERIRKFILVAQEWTVENNELTPTLKPRRSILYQKYKTEIEKIYPK